MRNVCVLVLLILISCPLLLADTQDTAVFRTALRADQEVPPVLIAGTSGARPSPLMSFAIQGGTSLPPA